ncbi:MAG TPA: CHAT domain-containing protein, partial [Leptolyngbyaceae cyanobacterium]
PLHLPILLLALLFVLSMAAPSVVAQITAPKVIAQVQPGKASYESGNFERAAQELQAAIADFAAKGDPLSQGVALRNLSLVYQNLGNWQAAEKAIADSLAILETQPKSDRQIKLLAEALDVLGRLERETGKLADAQQTWQKATALYKQIDDATGVAYTQIDRATALYELGFYPRACQTLREILGLKPEKSADSQSNRQACNLSDPELANLKNLPISPVNTLALRKLGNMLRSVGELTQAQTILQQSLAAAEKLQLPQDVAATQLSLGNNFVALALKNANQPELKNQYRQLALNAYQAAEKSPSSTLQLKAKLNQLSLLVESEPKSEPRSLWQSIEKPLMSLPVSKASVYSLINFAESLLKIDEMERDPTSSFYVFLPIESTLNLAIQQAKTLGDVKSQAYAMASLGKMYERHRQWQPAENITAQALSLASPLAAPDITYQLFWQLGRIYAARGDISKAIANYSQSINTLASLRSDLVTVNPDVQFSFRESVEPVYRELVSLLLEPTQTTSTGGLKEVSQANLKQARQVIESLQLAELDNFFQDACAQAKPKQIDEVDPDAAVFYPIILADRLEVIVSIPGEPLRHYATKKSQTELEEIFQKTRISLRPTAFPRERLPLAQQIYDWLIRPAEADLTKNQIKTLVFVLDGSLRNLPMASLYDGQQYLIQKYNIAITPGLQLLESRPLVRARLRALTGGLSEARQGFPPIPATITEVRQIALELPAEVLLNEEFTRANLQKQIQAVPFGVVHLATHGQFSSNADETFILAWDERVNVKQFDRLLRVRGQKQQRPIELFVLSACETATGDNRAALGLAGVAIRSGARSTLATLWQVNDESTAIFMTEFYRQLAKPGVNKAEAVRNAQLSLLAQSAYQNPYFWAPFVLVGNWQ